MLYTEFKIGRKYLKSTRAREKGHSCNVNALDMTTVTSKIVFRYMCIKLTTRVHDMLKKIM